MRYVESLGLLDHALGAPIRDVCSCNVNPFKASLSSGDSGLSAEARAAYAAYACGDGSTNRSPGILGQNMNFSAAEMQLS